MMSEDDRIIEFRGLEVSFGSKSHPVRAVRNVSYHLAAGETLAVVGESGSGKSVSSMTIMGLLDSPPARISPASIFYRGRDIGALRPEEQRALNGHRIAMIFQDPLTHLNPVYSVGWQIAEVFRAHPDVEPGVDPMARAIELMRRVGIPDPERGAHRYPHEFSGGQRQRVMIAMALALKPEVLIADEPTTALDVTVQAEILALIKSLQKEEGMALILITHDLGVAATMADRVVVMYRGSVVETGSVQEVFSAPQHAYTRMLLSARHPGGGAMRVPLAAAKEVIAVRQLSKRYQLSGGMLSKPAYLDAVKDVSFTLRRGETLAIVGESGSGKSTVARMLMRIGEPTSGSAMFHGEDILSMRGAALTRFRRRIQMIFQDPYSSLNPMMRVQEIIAEPWRIHRDLMPAGGVRGKARALLEQVGMGEEHLDRYPHEFSGGQRQRIAIARALAVEPEVIICDEAVSALDVSVQAQVTRLLKDLQERLGIAYIFISHDLDVVREIAHRVLVMKSGEVVEQGTADEVFSNPAHPYTRNLLAATPVIPWAPPVPSATVETAS